MIVRFSLFETYGNFDISFKICGDYEWLLRLNRAVNAKFLDYVSVRMGDGGVSTKNLRPVLLEVRRAQGTDPTRSKLARDLRLLGYAARIHLSRALRSGHSAKS